MKKALPFLLLLFLLKISYAQKRIPFDGKGLKVTWETVENNYKGVKETHSKLTLTNIGRSVFPGSGWTLYFNGPDLKNLTSGAVPVRRGLAHNSDGLRTQKRPRHHSMVLALHECTETPTKRRDGRKATFQ